MPARRALLVVDDNADLRGFLCRHLQGQWDIRLAANGMQGLALLVQQHLGRDPHGGDLFVEALAAGLHALHLQPPEQLGPAERQQLAFQVGDGLVDVGQQHHEAGGLAIADLADHYNIRILA